VHLCSNRKLLQFLNRERSSLAGKLDVLFLQDFFLAFEITIVGNDRLNKILQNRRAASRTQDVRDILRALSGQQTKTQTQQDLAAIRRYREKIRQRFSTIALFGEKRAPVDKGTSLSRMADIATGFVPVSLHDWHGDLNFLPADIRADSHPGRDALQGGVGSDESRQVLEIDALFFDNNEERCFLIRGLPGSGKTTLLRHLAHRYAGTGETCIPVYLRLRREDYSRFRPFDLAPMESTMIDDYLQRWFGDEAYKIEQLRRTFADRSRINTLASNPFLLSMICYTFEQGGDASLIARRSELYKNCTDFLLKKLYDPESAVKSQTEVENTLLLLKDLSWRCWIKKWMPSSATPPIPIGKKSCGSMPDCSQMMKR
ncbi:MAG: NACHT domain-containing protein, partial [bacterium]